MADNNLKNADMREFVLKGKMYYPSLFEEDKYGNFSFTLGNLTDDQVELAKKSLLKVHKKNEKEVKEDLAEGKADLGYFVKLKRKPKRNDGKENKPAVIIDKNKNKWDPEVGIGFGSFVAVKGVTIPYVYAGESGITNSYSKVAILDHVPYEHKESEADDIWNDTIKEEVSSDKTDSTQSDPFNDPIDDFY